MHPVKATATSGLGRGFERQVKTIFGEQDLGEQARRVRAQLDETAPAVG
jgi:hypothetical protein